MKKQPFTLIELLTVIVIIGILVGLSGAALMGGRHQARRTEARLGAEALRTAISEYEGAYGMLPYPDSTTNDTTLNDAEYNNMIQVLAGVHVDDNWRNPRRVSFLSATRTNAAYRYNDPWDNRYEVRLDTNYDGELELPDGTITNRSAAVWSDGDPAREGERPIYPWR